MKSMLCEASSVIKAIEEAWDKSGKPVEFTVKILEQGKKGFLWFGGEPTIISFAYEPKKQPVKHNDKPKYTNNTLADKRKQHQNQQPHQQSHQQPSQQAQKSPQPAVKTQPVKAQTPQKPATPQPVQHKEAPINKNKPIEPKNLETKEIKENINHWNQDFVQNIAKNLDDLCAILVIKTPYVIRTDNRKLHITFENRFLDASDEKMLFISLSYLLMQFVKKQFKKKFRGFHLILKSKDSAAHDDAKVPTK